MGEPSAWPGAGTGESYFSPPERLWFGKLPRPVGEQGYRQAGQDSPRSHGPCARDRARRQPRLFIVEM